MPSTPTMTTARSSREPRRKAAIMPSRMPSPSTMIALLQPVALARIDHEVGRSAALDQPGIEFLGLAQRRAAILAAMDDQGRGGRTVEPGERRSLDGETAQPLLGQRPAGDEGAEI